MYVKVQNTLLEIQFFFNTCPKTHLLYSSLVLISFFVLLFYYFHLNLKACSPYTWLLVMLVMEEAELILLPHSTVVCLGKQSWQKA